MVDDLSMDLLLKKVLHDSGYFRMLEEDKEIERIENIKELLHDMDLYVQSDPEGTLDDYLQMISLYTDKEETDESGQFVQLMTIHAAKGLEFDQVFVYSLCDGIFPNEKSVNDGGEDAMEEERRLAYVAFTRAKKQLFLSDAQGYSYMLDRVKTTSRFVKEIPDTYLEEAGVKPKKYQPSSRTQKPSFGISANDFLNNISNQTKERAHPIQTSPTYETNKMGKIKKGDEVIHHVYGEGVVISVKEGIATIAFSHKYGIRKINVAHPSLTRK